MYSLLRRLFTGNSQEMLAQIFERLHSHGSCIIHFAYYASLIFQKVGTIDENTHYTGALQNADYILPDGVALRLLVRRLLSLELHNLNGTDFVPQLLDALRSREEVRVFLYGGTPEVVEKMRVLVEGFYELPVVWAMDGYGDEVDPLKFSVFAGPGINLLLVARGSPRQEIWVHKNTEILRRYRFLTLTVGGLFDFMTGIEKRAPEWIRYCRLEWLYRALKYPKKNLRKTLVSFYLIKSLVFPPKE